jgi:hypothetical protein
MKSSTSETSISPIYTSGAKTLSKECVLGFLGLSILYFLLQIPGQSITPDDKYCASVDRSPPCTRPDLFAFEGVCATVFFLMTYMSVKLWYIDQHPQTCLPQTPAGRVYGYSPQCEKIAALSFIFQFWSCFSTPFIPEFYSPIMMFHHIMAATVSYLCLHYQYYHYYAVFFLALTEVSSVPLVIMSLGKFYPDSVFGQMIPFVQPLFVLSFSFYRVYLWNKIGYGLWSDSFVVMKKPSNGKFSLAENFRPGKTFVIYIMLGINFALGLLQMFWFSKIIVEITKVLGIDVF